LGEDKLGRRAKMIKKRTDEENLYFNPFFKMSCQMKMIKMIQNDKEVITTEEALFLKNTKATNLFK
jgi:hypothetical protein